MFFGILEEIKVVPVGFLFAEMGEGAQLASPSWGPGPRQRKLTFMAGPRKRQPERLVCQKFKMFLQKFPYVPEG